MQQLFSIQNKKLLMPVAKKEEVLQDCLWDNRKEVFQNHNFIFIDKEFSLKGQVHDLGNSGRIDILAYNKDTNRFIIFELKKDDGKYKGLYQATRYRNYIKHHFADVYLDATKKCKESLPHHDEVDKKKVEIIHIAKDFTQSIINEAKDEDSLITLIRYNWFGDDLLFLECVHNGTLPATQPKTKPPKWTQDIDKIWERIQVLIKKREADAKKLPDGDKKKNMEAFLRIANECVATRNAQRLLDAAKQPTRPRFISNAQKILDLQQNSLTSPGLEQ